MCWEQISLEFAEPFYLAVLGSAPCWVAPRGWALHCLRGALLLGSLSAGPEWGEQPGQMSAGEGGIGPRGRRQEVQLCQVITKLAGMEEEDLAFSTKEEQLGSSYRRSWLTH